MGTRTENRRRGPREGMNMTPEVLVFLIVWLVVSAAAIVWAVHDWIIDNRKG